MSATSRSLLLTLILLGVFVASGLALQTWLQREALRNQQEALLTKQAQLRQALRLCTPPDGHWEPQTIADIGLLLEGTLALLPPTAVPATISALPPGYLTVTAPTRDGLVALLSFPPPAAHRLAILHRRAIVVMIVLGLLVVVVPAALSLVRRPNLDAPTRAPWRQSRAEMSGLTEMARLTAERSEQLEHETGARQRAEEDLAVNRTLLSQSQEERARLGRELHDNICQTLYAVSLTLESVGKKLHEAPEASQRLTQSIAELRRLNQQVRAYLRDLEPGEIQRQSFVDALAQMLGALSPETGARITEQLDRTLISLITPEQAVHVVNILREAISNALRHGQARQITLRSERDEQTLALAVIDDGRGFDLSTHLGGGYGLANMKARAAALGATLRVESAPGKGTRILLLLPVPSPV